MVEVVIAEPGELSSAQLDSAEALVRSAFGSSFRSHDWMHAVPGRHVVLTDDDQSMVGFAAVVPRTLHHDGVAFDTGYVEAVAVRGDQQGRGLGRIIMDRVEDIIRVHHRLGALNAVATAAPFYASRRWQLWTGHTQAIGSAGVVDTFDSTDLIYLFGIGDRPLPDPRASLVCDWRPGHLW
ncbi:GNAT family N-acetyltransferase [Mycolicibacterium neoaurum]|uniref:GNAT family N-acetyltransferase n=1 Tax=Mycolicibacterium neoaurum TaxID=1795 RepID=UPI002671E080|nr:GNAT family N-acetyltransferase [Mycolicibacterium neoaurum]MDO3401260.1 GNAT family N-acetyltransferase [Mycolicibacterium neoaurum]